MELADNWYTYEIIDVSSWSSTLLRFPDKFKLSSNITYFFKMVNLQLLGVVNQL